MTQSHWWAQWAPLAPEPYGPVPPWSTRIAMPPDAVEAGGTEMEDTILSELLLQGGLTGPSVVRLMGPTALDEESPKVFIVENERVVEYHRVKFKGQVQDSVSYEMLPYRDLRWWIDCNDVGDMVTTVVRDPGLHIKWGLRLAIHAYKTCAAMASVNPEEYDIICRILTRAWETIVEERPHDAIDIDSFTRPTAQDLVTRAMIGAMEYYREGYFDLAMTEVGSTLRGLCVYWGRKVQVAGVLQRVPLPVLGREVLRQSKEPLTDYPFKMAGTVTGRFSSKAGAKFPIQNIPTSKIGGAL